MVGLCDCNNFYASCERVFNPSLEGRPLLVLSNNDGCVIARSNESKALGIKMGQPVYQIKHLIEQQNIAVYSSNFQLYGDMSNRVMETLRQLTPSIEIYSIDEAFIDFSNIEINNLQEIGRSIVRKVRRNVGIPVSIGIAPTKTLAKVASKLCKQYPKLEGCCVMYRKTDIEKVLSTFPIGDVWGIGRRYSKMLESYGIRTAGQFSKLNEEWIRAQMSIVGLRTHKELNGIKCIDFETRVHDKQSIMVSRSFSTELTDIESLREAISTFCSIAAEKLRKQSSVAAQLQVFIRTNSHREDKPQHYDSRVVNFDTSTDSTLEIVRAATAQLRHIYQKGFGYKKAGVILQAITPNSGIQSSIFDDKEQMVKHKELMKSVDLINEQFGKATVKVASSASKENPHSSKEHLSPRYTTIWDDILKIKI